MKSVYQPLGVSDIECRSSSYIQSLFEYINFFLRVEIEWKMEALIDSCKDSIETNCYGENLYQGPTNFGLSFLIKSFSNDKQSNLLWISQNLKEAFIKIDSTVLYGEMLANCRILVNQQCVLTTFHVNWLNACKKFCLVLSYLPVLLWKVFNQYLFVFLVFKALQSCHFLT